MLIKRTKSGNISFGLDQTEREKIFCVLSSFMEHESVMQRGLRLNRESEIMARLYYSVLNEIFKRKEFYLHHNCIKKIIFTASQAVAIMWLLRHHDHDSSMLDVKSGIHKQLLS